MTAPGPLSGKNILVTRGGKGGEELAEQIRARGGKAFLVPMIEFRAYEDPHAAEYIQTLPQYDWIIFTSKNGVKFFLQQCRQNGVVCENLNINWAAVGKKTAVYMENNGLKVAFTPRHFTAKDFAAEFLAEVRGAGEVLLPKGNLAGTMIADSLRNSGIMVKEWTVYETYLPKENKEKLAEVLKTVKLDYAMFASPSSFRHFKETADDSGIDLHRLTTGIVCIGPVTSRTVEAYGCKVSVAPKEYTIQAMLEALCQYIKRN
ncbi:uroporphyrinogen-III synthase [Heyndrickxia acidiproducens]|uniref:uroporphyrinogen-III synthase n=1 Tax=Heyndrickxia acidiproducens TaxID=1121084 RepID=UPI00037AC509|nr:uroporphyrinogen-III synthase [Heyndrickxia acidiproducens]